MGGVLAQIERIKSTATKVSRRLAVGKKVTSFQKKRFKTHWEKLHRPSNASTSERKDLFISAFSFSLMNWSDKRATLIVTVFVLSVSVLLSIFLAIFGARIFVMTLGFAVFRPKPRYFIHSSQTSKNADIVDLVLERSPDMLELQRRRLARASVHHVLHKKQIK